MMEKITSCQRVSSLMDKRELNEKNEPAIKRTNKRTIEKTNRRTDGQAINIEYLRVGEQEICCFFET